MTYKLKFFTILFTAFTLQACSGMGVRPNLGNTTDTNWFFQAKGKISMTIGKDHKSGNLDWKQEGFNYTVGIYSAFGIGATITGAPFFVEAKIPGGNKMQAASLDYLVQRGLNFPLPLSNMAYWIRGISAPGDYLWQEKDKILEQDGWRIEYSRHSDTKGFARKMPAKMDMYYGDLKIRIIVKQWIKL